MIEIEQVGGSSENGSGASLEDLPTDSDRVVLVVDDSSTIRCAMSVYLEKNGYTVVATKDVFSAIRVLSKIKPIIIFADIVMPRIDGYDFCALVNSNELLKDIPVVLVSSKNHLFDRARAKVSGCREFLSKPFTEQQLLDTIEEFVFSNKQKLSESLR